MEWVFSRLLGPRPLTGCGQENYLIERLAIIAAIEHITAFLGDWVLNAEGLDRAGPHPTMLDLLRWHGAEEVEHRSVAYDVMRYFDKRESRRIRTQVIVTPVIVWLWVRGTRFLMRERSGARPVVGAPAQAAPDRFLRGRQARHPPDGPGTRQADVDVLQPRSYHPSNEGSTAQAVKYLASSPAAQAAER